MTSVPDESATSDLARKVTSVFGGLAIDKRRLPMSRLQGRGIPGYVAEWVLDTIVPGQGMLSAEEAEKVQTWAARVIPIPSDQNVIKNRLRMGETVKVLSPVQVEVILKRKKQEVVAKLVLLGIDDAHVSDEVAARHQALLQRGMWGITELTNTPEGIVVGSFRPMQGTVDLGAYKEARRHFTLAEWRSLMLLSMGYSPTAYTPQEQTFLLCRLLPLVQKSVHLMELAPKGTGKSYIYENISPQVRLVSTPVSAAVLFVNNASGQWGILSQFKAVVLDEVQSLRFERPEEIIGGLKGFLANGKLTRAGKYEASSDCGLVLLANIALDQQQRPILDPLVRELPAFLRETAFLDRMKGLIPGWEIRKLTGECYADSVGLKSDFFGDTLIALREDLWADQYCAANVKLPNGTGRSEAAVQALASGLVKILFPDGRFTREDFYRNCVLPAIRLRQLVWDQLYALDTEFHKYDRELRCEITGAVG